MAPLSNFICDVRLGSGFGGATLAEKWTKLCVTNDLMEDNTTRLDVDLDDPARIFYYVVCIVLCVSFNTLLYM